MTSHLNLYLDFNAGSDTYRLTSGKFLNLSVSRRVRTLVHTRPLSGGFWEVFLSAIEIQVFYTYELNVECLFKSQRFISYIFLPPSLSSSCRKHAFNFFHFHKNKELACSSKSSIFIIINKLPVSFSRCPGTAAARITNGLYRESLTTLGTVGWARVRRTGITWT